MRLTSAPVHADHEAGQRPLRALTAAATVLWEAFPPRPVPAGWPATTAGREEVLARLGDPPFMVDRKGGRYWRRRALTAVLEWLATQPGSTWQERWDASGVSVDGRLDWRGAALRELGKAGLLTEGTVIGKELGVGLTQLICGDVLRPSVGWLLASRTPGHLFPEMARVRDGAGFAALAAAKATSVVGPAPTGSALERIAIIMAAKGGRVGDITPGDALELMRTHDQVFPASAYRGNGILYQLLHAAGVFPAGAPATVRMFSPNFGGQFTVEQLVDRYDLACRPVRDLLVDYLRERRPGIDYDTLTHLSAALASSFWKDLEDHHPGIDSLHLTPQVAAAWKQRIQTKTALPGDAGAGQKVKRLAATHMLARVRAFYLDLAQWAADDPARWGPWAVPCPIRAHDIRYAQDQTRRKSRMDARTRERLPNMQALIAAVDNARTTAADLLAAAAATDPGNLFTATGQTLRRTRIKTPSSRIWAEDPTTGARRDLTREEDHAFWSWAAIEVLRGTGIRIEELTELSHHSLVQYRLPTTGELIPLLQITPSKTDEERLLVISPELADVLSAVLGRIRADTGAVPLVAAYDTQECVWNPPMPLLFQRVVGLENRLISIHATRRLIEQTLIQIGLTDASGKPLIFLPHDFRRIFTTDAVMNGMPPHIAQLILGHKDINTTMGYKAVYPEEAINGHRAFIARRREQRPSHEYRTPTDAEWEEFLGHFERRKLALGDCGRAYSTTCIHEHSCVRCSLLRPDPAQRDRLIAIRDNLHDRITEARQQKWLGEVAGLQISLNGAIEKLDQIDGLTARRNTAVHLATPTFTQAAGRTTDS